MPFLYINMLKLFFIFWSFCCVQCVYAAPSQLDILLDNIWQAELKNNPTLASSLGDKRYNHLLTDMTPEGLLRRNKQYQAFLSQLHAFEQTDLSRSERITLQIQRYRLQNYVDQYRFHAHYMPINSESGFHQDMAFLPKLVQFKSAKDYQHYLARLQSLPVYFEQQIAWMQKGLASGMVQPQVVLKGIENAVSAYITADPKDSIFFQPFADHPNIPAEIFKSLQAEAKTIIATQVVPSYQAFHDFLVKVYIPGSKKEIAAKSLPNGAAYYQNRSEHYTTTQLSVEEIHQIGLQEVKRIRGEMDALISALAFDGDRQDFIHFLRTDKQFYAETAEQLIERAAYLSKQMDAQLPKLFYKLPRIPYGVAPVPKSIAPKYTTGRYISPRSDDQPGYYWVNTHALNKRPLYALPALTLHEAVPGHHLQISLASEMRDMPPVRRYTYISAFGEGWGLYAEYLGKEVGMYKTPYEEFGRLSYEMWRACRLVVDTGMHIKGWSRQQAIDFMLSNTALSEHNVRTEIDRYISWPAQALSYKLGELTIKQLRKRAEDTLKENFDLRAFHDAILSEGSVPLSVLEQNIKDFISNSN